MRHSWVRFLGSLVVVLGLVGPANAADWSAYIDHNARPTAQQQKQQTAPAQKRAKASKRSTKKVAKAKARAKARSKSKPRRK